ncbi:hypothetical protein ACVJH7_004154 [Bradyrhizobium elkanii]
MSRPRGNRVTYCAAVGRDVDKLAEPEQQADRDDALPRHDAVERGLPLGDCSADLLAGLPLAILVHDPCGEIVDQAP